MRIYLIIIFLSDVFVPPTHLKSLEHSLCSSFFLVVKVMVTGLPFVTFGLDLTICGLDLISCSELPQALCQGRAFRPKHASVTSACQTKMDDKIRISLPLSLSLSVPPFILWKFFFFFYVCGYFSTP